jgi:hypothetical protein
MLGRPKAENFNFASLCVYSVTFCTNEKNRPKEFTDKIQSLILVYTSKKISDAYGSTMRPIV